MKSETNQPYVLKLRISHVLLEDTQKYFWSSPFSKLAYFNQFSVRLLLKKLQIFF